MFKHSVSPQWNTLRELFTEKKVDISHLWIRKDVRDILLLFEKAHGKTVYMKLIFVKTKEIKIYIWIHSHHHGAFIVGHFKENTQVISNSDRLDERGREFRLGGLLPLHSTLFYIA